MTDLGSSVDSLVHHAQRAAVGSWQLAVGSWQLAVQIRTTDTQTKRKGDPGVAFVLFVMAEAA
ncbi:hypothetical protein CF126_03185 [Aeromonas dhakensis]|nr:hypothetical protein CF126_03185 [Aeromonas dhakensis]